MQPICSNILHIPHKQTKPIERSDRNMVFMYSFMAWQVSDF